MAPGKETGQQEDGGPGSTETMVVCRREGKAEFAVREASRGQEEQVHNGGFVQEVGRHMIVCTTAEEISEPRTHTDSLAQAVSIPVCSSIQHPASIRHTPAQPCATQDRTGQGGFLPDGRVDERGSAVSDAPGDWAPRNPIESNTLVGDRILGGR